MFRRKSVVMAGFFRWRSVYVISKILCNEYQIMLKNGILCNIIKEKGKMECRL